ncbi:hypothetical protein GCM10007881_07770 [Mesorhizobium huakuii]|nr:hypothetical protein GCM10007881_07770 [Mesorhizobium huakuii]
MFRGAAVLSARLCAALLVIVALGFATAPAAQATPHGGWNGTYPTARDACYAFWAYWHLPLPHPGYSRFTGAFPTDDPNVQRCHWTHYQDASCPYGPWGCTTIPPGTVAFACDSGYHRSLDDRCVEDQPPERPPGCPANPSAGNPIVLGSGAKYYQVEDFATQDGRFRIGRQYRSFVGGRVSSYNEPALTPDFGWQFNFDYELHLGAFSGSPSSPTGKVTLLTPDGSGYDFVLQSNGTWQAQAAMGAVSGDYRLELAGTLPSNLADMKAVPRQWKLTGPDDRVWTLTTMSPVNLSPASYNVGRPTIMRERDGYAWELNYSADGALTSIVDSFGRTASFTWHIYYPLSVPNAALWPRQMPEAVKDITFPDGTKATYLYDPAPTGTAPSPNIIQHLVGVEWRDSSGAVVDSNAYHYEDTTYPKFLTGVSDHRGVRIATYAYDADGRAVSTEGAGGANRVTVAYGTSGSQLTRTTTNALGRVSVYKFDHVSGSSWDIRFAGADGVASTNCPASASAVTYDGAGFVASTTDEEGRVTSYVRDSRDRATQITQAYGLPEARQTTITWHPTVNAPQQVVAPGLTVDYTYNSAGQLTGVTQTDTTAQTVPYSTNGQTRSWAYTYTTSGLLSSVDGPLPGTGDTVSYTYDAAGYLASVTDEVGNVTTVGVNGRGQPTAIADANGLVSTLTYDARGRITAKVDDPSGISARTEFAYDNAGNVTTLKKPDGSVLAMEYDGANRVTTVTNGLGDKVTYTYDAMGNRTREQSTDVNSQLFFEVTRTFDELGRLRQVIGVGPATWTYGYDKVGNPTSVTDPNSNTATSTYDGLDRLISLADERNSTTTQGFGATDDPTSTTDPRNVATIYVRNGWAR